jgi:hypothetical protein
MRHPQFLEQAIRLIEKDDGLFHRAPGDRGDPIGPGSKGIDMTFVGEAGKGCKCSCCRPCLQGVGRPMAIADRLQRKGEWHTNQRRTGEEQPFLFLRIDAADLVGNAG